MARSRPIARIDPRTDLYGQILFHRGRFQRVEGYRELSATRCLAEVSPDGQARWFGGYLPETLLLGDAAIRDAAIHAIQACIPHGTILPIGIDRVFTGERPLTGPCSVRAQEREHVGDRFVYDLDNYLGRRPQCERWEGLRLQRVDQAKPTRGGRSRCWRRISNGGSASWCLVRRRLLPSSSRGDTFDHAANGDDATWLTAPRRSSNEAIAAAVGEASRSASPGGRQAGSGRRSRRFRRPRCRDHASIASDRQIRFLRCRAGRSSAKLASGRDLAWAPIAMRSPA